MASWLKHISHSLLRTGTLKWLLLGSCVGLITGIISFLLYLGIDITSGLLLKGLAGYAPSSPTGEHHLDFGPQGRRPKSLAVYVGDHRRRFSHRADFVSVASASRCGDQFGHQRLSPPAGRIPLSVPIWKFFAR